MPDDDRVLIGHMLDMAQTDQRHIAGATRAELDADEKLQLSLVRAPQVIGEAGWRVSHGFQDRHAAIPWKKIAGFRHRVVHNYFSIDYDIVWRVATQEMEPLIDALAPLLEGPPPNAASPSP